MTNPPSHPRSRRVVSRWKWLLLAGVVGLCCLAAVFLFRKKQQRRNADAVIAISFDGSSEKLLETVVVPTLDTPLPEGKAAVWCSSFQLAWNRLKTDLAKGPIQLENAENVTERLNSATAAEADLAPGTFYATAGLVRDGVVETIRAEMARRFPNVPNPEVSGSELAALAYGYLSAGAQYSFPFLENPEPFLFRDTAGNQTAVTSFGITEKLNHPEARRQVEVLWHDESRLHARTGQDEFALDLCKDSEPNQLIVACLDGKATLAATLARLHQRIRETPVEEYRKRLGPIDSVLVPNMHWRIHHHFRELEGADKQFLNPSLRGLFLGTARQTVQFRLDRNGAEVSSEAALAVKGYRHFRFERPFLIVLQKRGAAQPFFVMWVSNAELLQPW